MKIMIETTKVKNSENNMYCTICTCTVIKGKTRFKLNCIIKFSVSDTDICYQS